MDTKWKNRWVLLVWLLLFSHGVSGIMNGLLHGRDYIRKDYFETPQFEQQLERFMHTLSLFELNYLPKEEAKKLISVTTDDINEHRTRYGNLSEQVSI